MHAFKFCFHNFTYLLSYFLLFGLRLTLCKIARSGFEAPKPGRRIVKKDIYQCIKSKKLSCYQVSVAQSVACHLVDPEVLSSSLSEKKDL